MPRFINSFLLCFSCCCGIAVHFHGVTTKRWTGSTLLCMPARGGHCRFAHKYVFQGHPYSPPRPPVLPFCWIPLQRGRLEDGADFGAASATRRVASLALHLRALADALQKRKNILKYSSQKWNKSEIKRTLWPLQGKQASFPPTFTVQARGAAGYLFTSLSRYDHNNR